MKYDSFFGPGRSNSIKHRCVAHLYRINKFSNIILFSLSPFKGLGLLLLISFSLKAQDKVADNMLIYQRAIGGWPKHINEVKIDYTKTLFDEQKHDVIADSLHNDATIDNGATIKEIRYLANAYKTKRNEAYLRAVEKGIGYLLKAQNNKGGWPQYYPDSSIYRGQITFNDNAMVNVLNVLMDVTQGTNNMNIVDASLKPRSTRAILKGVQCILNTQIKVHGTLTAWCAQYDQRTLKPAMARKFEPASISGSESVGIVEFLMRIEHPSAEIKNAVNAAVEWFKRSKITGYRYTDIEDKSQPNGRDRVILPDPSGVLWARFYDIETNEPIFSGRDSIIKKNLKDIEHERRTGYAYYGTWAKKLLDEEYGKWVKGNI